MSGYEELEKLKDSVREEVRELVDELLEEYDKNRVMDKIDDDGRLTEIFDGAVPVYTDDIMEIGTVPEVYQHENELPPAFGGEPTPSNVIATAIYEILEEVALDEVKEYLDSIEQYEVLVGNIGTIYRGTDGDEARKLYAEYIDSSKSTAGRAGGEHVILMVDGDIEEEYIASDDEDKGRSSQLKRLELDEPISDTDYDGEMERGQLINESRMLNTRDPAGHPFTIILWEDPENDATPYIVHTRLYPMGATQPLGDDIPISKMRKVWGHYFSTLREAEIGYNSILKDKMQYR